MNVAVTVWEDRISPVFDAANMLLIARIEEQRIVGRSYEKINVSSLGALAVSCKEKEIKKVICGAVSEESLMVFQEHGVELIPFISGEIENVLSCFCKGENLETFIMPGCLGCKCRNGKRRRTS